jgi:hypothetical protein
LFFFFIIYFCGAQFARVNKQLPGPLSYYIAIPLYILYICAAIIIYNKVSRVVPKVG